MIFVILFGSLLLFIILGIPVSFTLGALSLIFGFILWGGLLSVDPYVLGVYGKVMDFSLTALPLYIFMAGILRYSDLADDMYEAMYRWLGNIKGGLAAGTSIISTIFSAMVGIATVATATLALTARPSMLSRGYNNRLTAGVILAGGTLGILIPPSILMIIFANETSISAGGLFFAGVIPGIIACLLFIVYSIGISYMLPGYGPAIPEDTKFTFREKLSSLKGIILPIGVIIIVLGVIYLGIATPTEAAAFGVVGSLISAAIKKKLTYSNMKKMLLMTINLNGMIFWLIISAVAYSRIVTVSGVASWFGALVTDLEVNRWIILICMQIVFFILGMFLDTTGILLMTAPLFTPVILELGFDPIWYGVIFIINMCIAYLTPPFGFSLFVFRGVAPDIPVKDLYLSTIPFVIIFIILIALVMIFPPLATWLPTYMMK